MSDEPARPEALLTPARKSCTVVRSPGELSDRRGESDYDLHLDRDGDGIGWEPA